MTAEDVYNWFIENFNKAPINDEATQVLYQLMLDDKLSIEKLVGIKERAMRVRYNTLKEDASECCAITLMYKEKIYETKDSKGKPTNGTKEDLDRRAVNILRKLGFYKI